jgi:hypothetical protein
MNQARDLAHKPAQKLANAALFKAAGQTRFKTGTILPVYARLLSNQIVTIQLTSDLVEKLNSYIKSNTVARRDRHRLETFTRPLSR